MRTRRDSSPFVVNRKLNHHKRKGRSGISIEGDIPWRRCATNNEAEQTLLIKSGQGVVRCLTKIRWRWKSLKRIDEWMALW